MKKISYFVKLKNPHMIKYRRWYVDEINILKNEYECVAVSTNYRNIPWDADIYLSWWAQTSLFSVLRAVIRRRKSYVIAGGAEVSKAVQGEGYNGKNFFKRIVLKISLALCTKIVAVSEYNKIEILQVMGERYKDKIEIMYHCVDDEYFANSVKTNFIGEKYMLLISGFTRDNFKRKCVYQILDSIAESKESNPELSFVLAGSKESEEEYAKVNAYLKEKGIADIVKLKTDISEEEKLQLLRNAYLYIQPTFHEQFGVAVAEAMASGCPVVSTNVAAVPEVVGNAGILINNNSVDEISRAINNIYKDEKYRNSLAVRARERAYKNFRYEIKRKRLLDIICDK